MPDAKSIESLPFVERCHHLNEIDSTNTFAKSLPVPADNKITVVWAGRQTGGRGRDGRSFFSSVNGGLWVSVVVPLPDISRHFALNRSLSLAIAETLEAIAPAAVAIKWPNDIFWGDKKICGILLESSNTSQNAVVAGFGLDLSIRPGEFPPDIASIATSVLIETGKNVDKSDVLSDILSRFDTHRRGETTLEQSLYARRLYRAGSAIEIDGRKGIFEGVDAQGRLCLAEGHSVHHLTSGIIQFADEL